MNGKGSCRLMNLPFSACPATNKGIWVQKLTPEYSLYLAVSMPQKIQSVIKAKAILPSGVLLMYNCFV